MSRLRAVAVLAAASLSLAGCQSTLSTSVRVTPTADVLTATLTLTGNAAQVISASPALVASLDHVLTSRLGPSEHATVTPSLVSWSSTLTYAQLQANADVLGVASLSSTTGSDPQVTAVIVEPRGLVRALAAGVAAQPDHVALLTTMLRYVTLSVSIDFAGPAHLVSASGLSPRVDGSSVVLVQALHGYRTGSFVAQGPASTPTTWYWWAAGVVAVLALVVILGRPRRPRRH